MGSTQQTNNAMLADISECIKDKEVVIVQKNPF